MKQANLFSKPEKIYHKSNSFVGLRQAELEKKEVVQRMGAIRSRLEMQASRDYRAEIVLQACHDIIEAKPSSKENTFQLFDHVAAELMRIKDDELFDYLFYRYRYDIFPIQKRIDGYPPCLQIEPASICNYRCVFCYQTDESLTRRSNGHMGVMSLDLFKKVIDEAEDNVEAITLASRGEPSVNKNLDKMLSYAGGKFLAFKINTNASFLDERLGHAILQSEVNTVVFSADAASEPLYSQMRVNGTLEKVLNNIRQFKKLRDREYPTARTITRVSGVKFRAEQDLDEMQKVWGELVDQVAFVDYNPWENTYERPINDIVTPCSDLWRRMFIWWDGKANPCDVDYLSKLQIGNANDENLSEIWQGKGYTSLREAHSNNERKSMFPCHRCTVI